MQDPNHHYKQKLRDDQQFAQEHWRWEREFFADVERIRAQDIPKEEILKQEQELVTDWTERKKQWMISVGKYKEMGRL